MTTATLGKIRYNAGSAAYEALAEFRDSGATRRYPCSVEAPLNAPMTAIKEALLQDAEDRAATPGTLFSRV
ncbi:hypothetical protein AADZ90_001960 [Aestuariibius sp. 2305UL40-4]|uniref:hypothetical protein n=1 Tax=Aestuariibius violaceus TaxID=3234132 RepID=UPI00345E6DAB